MRQVVVAKKDGIHRRALLHDLLKHQPPQGKRGRRRIEKLQSGLINPSALQSTAPSVQALHHSGVQLRGSKRNAPPSARQQMPCHGGTRLCLLKTDTVRRFIADTDGQIHQVHTRHLTAFHEFACGGVVVQTCDQQTCRTVQQLFAQQLLFFAGVVMGHPHQRLETCGTQGFLGGIQQVHKQGVGQQGNQDGHMVAALRGQGAGGGVGHIPELAGDRLDALNQSRVDRTLTPQGARYRAGAHASRLGHITQGDSACGTVTFNGLWGCQNRVGQGLIRRKMPFINR